MMKYKYKLAWLFITITLSESYALQIRMADNHAVIHAEASSVISQAIIVQSDRINNYVILRGDPTIKIDESTGILYVNLSNYHQNKLFISIATEKGKQFTLFLKKVSHVIEPILIEFKEDERSHATFNDSKEIETLMQNMQANQAHPGDIVSTPKSIKINRLAHYSKSLKKRYENRHYIGSIYELTSREQQSLLLNEKDFFNPKIAAVMLSKKNLDFNEKCTLYTVERK